MGEREAGHRRQTFGLWFAVAVCLMFGISPVLAPRAPNGDDAAAISVDRALAHVEFIAQEPHVMGNPEIERVHEYVITSLNEIGLVASAVAMLSVDAVPE